MNSDGSVTCSSCHLTIAPKGDREGWKGVQIDPDVAELSWFCMGKLPCADAFDRAVERAAEAWRLAYGYDVAGEQPQPDKPDMSASDAELLMLGPDDITPDESMEPKPGWLIATEDDE